MISMSSKDGDLFAVFPASGEINARGAAVGEGTFEGRAVLSRYALSFAHDAFDQTELD